MVVMMVIPTNGISRTVGTAIGIPAMRLMRYARGRCGRIAIGGLGDRLGVAPMPGIGSAVTKLDSTLMHGSHVPGVVVLLGIAPKPTRVKNIDQPRGFVPFGWDAKRLGIYVGGLQGGTFIEQIATEIPEAFRELTQTNTMRALNVAQRRRVAVAHSTYGGFVIFMEVDNHLPPQ